MRKLGFNAVVVVAAFLSAMCHGQTNSTPSGKFCENILGPVPDPVMLILSADKRHVVYVMPYEDKKQVLIDGHVAGPDLDVNTTFVEQTFSMSADGKRAGYAVGKEDPNNDCHTCGPQAKWHEVIDGIDGPEYDKTTGIAFSPNGKHVAYAAINKKKGVDDDKDHWVLVVDGNEKSIPYEAISRDTPVYAADGKLVYIAKKNEKAVVVVDGEEGIAFDKIKQSTPVFSRDGKHMAYVARNYHEHPDTVIMDGKHGPYFDNIPETSLVFSPDGRHFAYGAQTGDLDLTPEAKSTWAVVVDNKQGPQYDQVDNIIFSPDGKHVAYRAKKNGKWMLVVDGKSSQEHDALMLEDGKSSQEHDALLGGFPVFSPDNSRIAYGFKDGSAWKVSVEVLGDNSHKNEMLSGILGGEYDKVGTVTFSPDGKHLAFAGINGKKKTVVVDGKNGPEQDFIDHIFFSPDGQHLAYEAGKFLPDKDDEWFMVIDGQPRPVRDSLVRGSFLFSKDSKHGAYIISNGKLQQVVVDGQASSGYKSICHLLPTGDNGFESIVIKNESLCQMVWKP